MRRGDRGKEEEHREHGGDTEIHGDLSRNEEKRVMI
jgi:hypothetical protein